MDSARPVFLRAGGVGGGGGGGGAAIFTRISRSLITFLGLTSVTGRALLSRVAKKATVSAAMGRA